jgi:hypothetical protein
MSAVEPLLEASERPPHLVQLYQADDAALVSNLVGYLSDGLSRGEFAIAVVSDAHREAVMTGLLRTGCDVARLICEGRLTLIRVDDMLERLMVDEVPDAKRFEENVGALVRATLGAANGRGVRVYGEIVGVLWETKQFPAAIRLEQLWHRLQQELGFSLYCGYPIDVFGKHFDGNIIDALLCAHTHLLPTVTNGELERALDRAMEELLGLDATDVKGRLGDVIANEWGAFPSAEATILWLRRTHPRYADTILESAKIYYQAAVRRGSMRAL